jgi:peroxiredoxin
VLRSLFSLLMLVILAPFSWAGEFNKVLSVGDAAPEWKSLEGTDGKKHSLADLKESEFVVVVFTCNSCAISVGYEDRIVAFATLHAGAKTGVTLIAINVNTIAADTLPEMKKRAEKKKFPFDYLYDPSQEIAKKFGATTTPEFFVLDQARTVIYMGALDDKLDPADATVNHLAEALAVARGAKKEILSETLPRGCKIRFLKKKDD